MSRLQSADETSGIKGHPGSTCSMSPIELCAVTRVPVRQTTGAHGTVLLTLKCVRFFAASILSQGARGSARPEQSGRASPSLGVKKMRS